ncbi:MAG: prolipoprotein diacylglyceryl transferase [Actinomycetota bacterium]
MAPIAMLSSIGWPVVDRFRLGDSFAISPHGLFIAIGFMLGAWLFGRIAVARGVEERAISSIVLWSLIGAIVGARFFYVVAHWSEFAPWPVVALLIGMGGISLLGGIAGATIANAINIRRFGLRFFQVADALAAPLALGIAVGRIGDLIIGDHLGKPTSWLLAWRYSGGTVAPPFECLQEFCQAPLQGDRLQTLERSGSKLLDSTGAVIASGVGVHQTALYDMLLAWGLFALLWWFTKRSRREGLAALVFAIYYGCCRLLEDFLRIDKRFGPLTGSQWTALTVVVVCVAIWGYLAVSKRPGPTTPPRPPIRRRARSDAASASPATG